MLQIREKKDKLDKVKSFWASKDATKCDGGGQATKGKHCQFPHSTEDSYAEHKKNSDTFKRLEQELHKKSIQKTHKYVEKQSPFLVIMITPHNCQNVSNETDRPHHVVVRMWIIRNTQALLRGM